MNIRKQSFYLVFVLITNLQKFHCVKSVQICRFFWSVFPRIWAEYGEILLISNTGIYGPEKTPYLDTFHAVLKSRAIMIYKSIGGGKTRNLDEKCHFYIHKVLHNYKSKSKL